MTQLLYWTIFEDTKFEFTLSSNHIQYELIFNISFSSIDGILAGINNPSKIEP